MIKPRMVYKKGSKIKVDGSFFDFKIVESSQESDPPEGFSSDFEKAVADDGWFSTPAEAQEGTPSDESEPTREELKLMAEQLGIEFNSSMSTKRLAALVEKATEG